MLTGQDGAVAAVNVSSSAGDGGGLAANVNRWRGQLGLPPEDEISTVTIDVPGGKAQLVDMSGKCAQPASLRSLSASSLRSLIAPGFTN